MLLVIIFRCNESIDVVFKTSIRWKAHAYENLFDLNKVDEEVMQQSIVRLLSTNFTSSAFERLSWNITSGCCKWKL